MHNKFAGHSYGLNIVSPSLRGSHIMAEFISTNDSQLLDAYSSTVTGVIKRTSQAVVHIRATRMTNEQAGEHKAD